MSNVEIKITLPGELVERARAIGLNLEDQNEAVIEAVEQAIKRREAGEKLLDIAKTLRAMPDEEKPSLAEIDEAVRRARLENRANDPDIQREIRQIDAEFRVTEFDRLDEA